MREVEGAGNSRWRLPVPAVRRMVGLEAMAPACCGQDSLHKTAKPLLPLFALGNVFRLVSSKTACLTALVTHPTSCPPAAATDLRPETPASPMLPRAQNLGHSTDFAHLMSPISRRVSHSRDRKATASSPLSGDGLLDAAVPVRAGVEHPKYPLSSISKACSPLALPQGHLSPPPRCSAPNRSLF